MLKCTPFKSEASKKMKILTILFSFQVRTARDSRSKKDQAKSDCSVPLKTATDRWLEDINIPKNWKIIGPGTCQILLQ